MKTFIHWSGDQNQKIAKDYHNMSTQDIELINQEIVNYMIKNKFRYKEKFFLEIDDVCEELYENIEIRKAAGNPENLRSTIYEFIYGR